MKTICGAVCSAVVAIAFDVGGQDAVNLGPRARNALSPRDFETVRADGRFESDVAWANDMVMNMKPVYSLDTVTRAEDFPVWRGKVREKLRDLLQVPDPLPKVEFKLLSEDLRNGYRLQRYEFYPEPRLAVRMMMLVPDAAKARKVPAMVALPGSGASLESLVGEPSWDRTTSAALWPWPDGATGDT